MYQAHKTYIRPNHLMSDLIEENPAFLLLMEHFEMDFCVSDKTVEQLCDEYRINLPAFLIIANLYNGFYPHDSDIDSVKDMAVIIHFLKISHKFYINDKYPEIQAYIKELKNHQDSDNIILIEKFFSSYFREVLEHFDYEDKTAFPYFNQLIESSGDKRINNFSATEYREHHTDIETKLDDLKNLLMKHIELKDDLPIRRRLIQSLFELEFDLKIHSVIEEKVLLPLVGKIENNLRNG